jgi:hypothetical protein
VRRRWRCARPCGVSFSGSPRASLTLLFKAGPSREHATQALLRHLPEFAAHFVGHTESVRYAFAELNSWRKAIDRASGPWSQGVIFTDVDERANVVTVGVRDAQTLEAARAHLAATGVPLDAVDLKISDLIVPFKTLQSWMGIAPWAYGGICGGAQVTGAIACSAGPGPGGFMNYSFGFLVASHCTSVWGQTRSALARDDLRRRPRARVRAGGRRSAAAVGRAPVMLSARNEGGAACGP